MHGTGTKHTTSVIDKSLSYSGPSYPSTPVTPIKIHYRLNQNSGIEVLTVYVLKYY